MGDVVKLIPEPRKLGRDYRLSELTPRGDGWESGNVISDECRDASGSEIVICSVLATRSAETLRSRFKWLKHDPFDERLRCTEWVRRLEEVITDIDSVLEDSGLVGVNHGMDAQLRISKDTGRTCAVWTYGAGVYAGVVASLFPQDPARMPVDKCGFCLGCRTATDDHGTEDPATGTGWIYFLRAGTSGPIKIGTSVNVDSRIATLQTGCPDELRLIARIRGGSGVERMLHQKFDRDRIRGEWFKPSSELVELIKELTGDRT